MGHKQSDDAQHEPSLELPSLFSHRRKVKHKSPVEEPEGNATFTPEPTAPLFVEDAAHRQTPDAAREHHVQTAASAGGGDRRSRRDGFTMPVVPGRVAVAVTGLAVGVFGTILTYFSLAGCEAVQGTSSCGGPGLFLLVAILALMILLGALLLKAWSISDPGSTSFLAVGLVAVVVLVALLDVIFSAWMFLLMPIISGGSYVLSHGVTSRFADAAGADPPHHHDIR